MGHTMAPAAASAISTVATPRLGTIHEVSEWITFYNTVRAHSVLEYRTPDPGRGQATDVVSGKSRGRHRAILMTASGQPHDRHWVVSRGCRHPQ